MFKILAGQWSLVTGFVNAKKLCRADSMTISDVTRTFTIFNSFTTFSKVILAIF